MKINRKKNPPSIQDPKNAYGFEEGPNGDLVPQAPPEKDPSIGPAYYNTVRINWILLFIEKIATKLDSLFLIQITSNHLSSDYKGVHFAKYAPRQWNQIPKASGPGPGEYDVIEPVKIDVEHYHMKNNLDKKPELNIPRFTEMITRTVEKEVRLMKEKTILIWFQKFIVPFQKSIPGPGKYEQKRLFDNGSKSNELGIETEKPPFGTQSRVGSFWISSKKLF